MREHGSCRSAHCELQLLSMPAHVPVQRMMKTGNSKLLLLRSRGRPRLIVSALHHHQYHRIVSLCGRWPAPGFAPRMLRRSGRRPPSPSSATRPGILVTTVNGALSSARGPFFLRKYLAILGQMLRSISIYMFGTVQSAHSVATRLGPFGNGVVGDDRPKRMLLRAYWMIG